MLRPQRVSAPSVTPISLFDAKTHCRVDHDDDDSLISGLIDAAVAHVDGWAGVLGRCLISQAWEVSLSTWPSSGWEFPFPDCKSVAIKYVGVDDVEHDLDESNYSVIAGEVFEWAGSPSLPPLASRADAVTIQMTVGFGPTASDVPMSIRHALKMLVAYWYAQREMASGEQQAEIPMGVSQLLAPHRRVSL